MKATGFFVAMSCSTNLGRKPLSAAVPRLGATEANAAITTARGGTAGNQGIHVRFAQRGRGAYDFRLWRARVQRRHECIPFR